ncbi:type I toxin-antitoxin system Fst family toxin [Pseudolactococcus yaeyamensis]
MLVVVPLLVDILVELFAYWLNKHNDDR